MLSRLKEGVSLHQRLMNKPKDAFAEFEGQVLSVAAQLTEASWLSRAKKRKTPAVITLYADRYCWTADSGAIALEEDVSHGSVSWQCHGKDQK